MTEEHEHHHAAPPEQMTEPCVRYFQEHRQLGNFMGFISGLALRADEVVSIATKALYETSNDEAEKTNLQEALERGPVATQALRSHRQLLLQMMLCRGVDNYLTYISAVMSLIFRLRPETLRSGEQVRLDVVLRHQTMDDLVSDLADRRVNQLSYLGMDDLSGELSDRLGFSLFEQSNDLQRAARIIEIRNLIVHNRAVVNRFFQSKVPDNSTDVGQPLTLEVDPVFSDLEFLAISVSAADTRAVEKFNLPSTPSRNLA